MATAENNTPATATATILPFPAAVVAAKAERARRVAYARRLLSLSENADVRLLCKVMPERWLAQFGECCAV
jgi:hypothetical protein